MTTMKPPCGQPCNECPWRREARPGWLGPHTAEQWLTAIHSDEPVACHLTIDEDDGDHAEMTQCSGAAIYRSNVAKSPRWQTPADSLPADREAVFGFGEFEEHHHLTAHDRAVIADFEAKQALTKEFPNLSGNDALILLNALTDSVRHHTAEEVRHHDFAQRISGQRNGEPERHSRHAATERAKVETLDSVLEVFRIERSLRLMHESGVIGEILNRRK